ncbi:MAG TPA: NAD(P)-binding protein, partial [Planctomycetaceae bacterium]|nr:NAD(P)-binding protein [Planctomycetaceae bacterium]
MIEEYELAMIGLGPTGIGAAWRARELGLDDFVMLEADSHAGGLAASFRDRAGFTWDQGVHLHFSHYEKYDRFLDDVLPTEEWLRLDRSAAAQIGGSLVPYPVQLHLHHLPAEPRWECLRGLLEATDRPRGKPANFREWCEQTFGTGLARHFLWPYNEKVWAHPLHQLGCEWVGERVAIPELQAVLKRLCLSEDRHDWGPNAQFRYPRRGGSGRLWSEAARRIPADQ